MMQDPEEEGGQADRGEGCVQILKGGSLGDGFGMD